MMDDLDADEFFDVYRIFKSDSTREEFMVDWREFQRLKRECANEKDVC